jgi:nucleoside-diphosphate-sugar epimerase
MKTILVTGANGQIGSELVDALRRRHGPEAVVGFDLHPAREDSPLGPHVTGDVRDQAVLQEVMATHNVDTVYHLASLLSATGEQYPERAWDVNMNGLKHILDLAHEHNLKLFWPSSIAVFGPSTPRHNTPQETVLNPTTMYGVTKRSGELLCRYYHQRHGVDVRSVRYPGLISHQTEPGGGTTDYAVDMYRAAARGTAYTCYLSPDTRLPMMYMPDAIRATLRLMDAEPGALSVRDSYNLTAFSFSAGELAAHLHEHAAEGFAVSYDPDDRQSIADNWPATIDDRAARADWNWQPEYDLDAMTADMLAHLPKANTQPQHA